VALLVYAFKLVSQTDPGSRTILRPAGSIYGWGYWPVWALAGTGTVLLAAFVHLALRGHREGVMDPRLFARRDFAMGSLITWIGSVFMFGVMFLLPVYFQSLRLPALSPLHTGLALLPLGIGTLIGTILGAALDRRLGGRPIVVAGGLLMALGSWGLRDLAPTTPIGDFWPALGLVGVSFTLIAVPAQTVTLAALSGSVLTKASALLQATKLLFASIGSAVLVTLFVTQTTWHANRQSASTLAGAHGPAGRQMLAAQAGTGALHDVFIIIIYGALAVALVAMFLPSGRPAGAALGEPTTNAA
jgi:predicted MFS family arabinose efflux permease